MTPHFLLQTMGILLEGAVGPQISELFDTCAPIHPSRVKILFLTIKIGQHIF